MSIITLNTRSLPDSAVTTAKVAADAITDAKIADDVVGTEHLTAGEVDATALGADSVTAAKINNDIISGTTALTSEPADTDEFLVSDAGTLKRIDYSLIKGGGITEADQYRLTANVTSDTNPLSSNLERSDDNTFEKIGTGMSVSSGTFSFPSTGLYQVITTVRGYSTSTNDSFGIYTNATPDNSTYDTIAQVFVGSTDSATASQTATMVNFVNVDNTSNVKVQFEVGSMASGSVVQGDTNQNKTSFTFIRLGDSQ